MSVTGTAVFTGLSAAPDADLTTGNAIAMGNIVDIVGGGAGTNIHGFAVQSLSSLSAFYIWNEDVLDFLYYEDLSAVEDVDGVDVGNGMIYFALNGGSGVTLTESPSNRHIFTVVYKAGVHIVAWYTNSNPVVSSRMGVTAVTSSLLFDTNTTQMPSMIDENTIWLMQLYLGGVVTSLVGTATALSTSVFRKAHPTPLVADVSTTFFSASGGTGSAVVSTSTTGLAVDADTLSIDAAPGADALVSATFSALYDGTPNPFTIDLDISVLSSFEVATADVTPVDAITAAFDTLRPSGGTQITLSASTFTSRMATTTMTIDGATNSTGVAFTQGTTVTSQNKATTVRGSMSLQGASSLTTGTGVLTLEHRADVELEDGSTVVMRRIVSPGTTKLHTTTTGRLNHTWLSNASVMRLVQVQQTHS